MAERLKDKAALVTSAANGIGLAIADLITPRSVISHLRGTNKRQALQDLAKHTAGLTGFSDRGILDVLIERERLGSTGTGMGIGIPHGRRTTHDKRNPDISYCCLKRINLVGPNRLTPSSPRSA
jgi:mannitol/fructose-specific phosphotransferase system IIA component (Ntr-type)